MRNNLESNRIAKNFCKEYKYRLDDVYEDMFIASAISDKKADRCNGKHFKNWDVIKYRFFEAFQILPNNDCVRIKNLGNRHHPKTKTFFNSTIINNLSTFRI